MKLITQIPDILQAARMIFWTHGRNRGIFG